jgi:hypothetical protein
MTTSLADVRPLSLQRSPGRSVAALLEEQLIIPSYASRWAFASIGLHRAMSLSLQLRGPVRRRSMGVDGRPVEVLTIGRPKLVDAVCTGLLGDLPAPSPEGRRLSVSPAGLARLEADLVVAEVHRWMAPHFRRNGWLIVPRSVRWHGDLALVPPAHPSRSLLANLAKLRKYDFRLVQANSPDDWQEFYTTMVEPQAKARHGTAAWTPSQPFLRGVAGKGTLHFVVENGLRVAGLCTIPCGDTLWFPLMGVRHGDAGLLQRGASVAAIALPIEWARQNNYRFVDLGRTGSFVNDGLQQYKRKWGFVPVLDPLSLVTAVWIGSAEARQAFSREPVLVETGSGLETYAGEAG